MVTFIDATVIEPRYKRLAIILTNGKVIRKTYDVAHTKSELDAYAKKLAGKGGYRGVWYYNDDKTDKLIDIGWCKTF